MLSLKGFLYILEWKIPNQTDWQSLVAICFAKYEKIHMRIIEEFGPNGLLIVGLFGIFLGLILFIYIKAVLDTLRGEKSETWEDDYIDDMSVEEAEAKLDAEKELSLHLIEASANSDDILGLGQDYERLKKSMQKYAKKQQKEFVDWKSSSKTKVLSVKQLQTRKNISLIVKMLARQVSEAKVAQTLARRLNTDNWEYVLQTVRSVRDFIGLANANMFAELPDYKTLPRPKEALRELCEKGDNTLCLQLLQKLTSQYIHDAMPQTGITRQMLLAQAANYACLTGNFAALDDIELAMTSYNFATEVSPESPNAWSRLGDTYIAKANEVKAMFAYQAVLELADPHMYQSQIANAKIHLAPYYKHQGLEDKAKEYELDASRYYKECGIATPLTAMEDAAADYIISRQEISESLEILLK